MNWLITRVDDGGRTRGIPESQSGALTTWLHPPWCWYASGKTRTCDPPLRRRMLYPLSYKRISGRRDLNSRQPAWKAGTLPLSYSRIYSLKLFKGSKKIHTDLILTEILYLTRGAEVKSLFYLYFYLTEALFATSLIKSNPFTSSDLILEIFNGSFTCNSIFSHSTKQCN